MTWHSNIKIRSISGWTTRPQCTAMDEHGEQCTSDKGHETHNFPERITTTPAERLAAVQAALKEGTAKVVLATEVNPECGGFVVEWSSNKGFGALTVVMRPDGTIRIDNEGDSRKALAELLLALLEQGTLVDEPDPSGGTA